MASAGPSASQAARREATRSSSRAAVRAGIAIFGSAVDAAVHEVIRGATYVPATAA